VGSRVDFSFPDALEPDESVTEGAKNKERAFFPPSVVILRVELCYTS
jgi:hypothetical protein